MSSPDITGTVWLVTGAAAGFGRAICEEILARGGKVVATARDPAKVADIAAIAPDRVLAAPLDVTSQAQIDACVKDTIARFGKLDVLVNNAGHGFMAALEEASEEEVRQLFDVNVFGLAALTRAFLPHMRAAKTGKVINFSSIAGVRGSAGAPYYCASKFAVEGMSEALAKELEPFGIGVMIVEPGAFRTDFFGRSMLLPKVQMPEYEFAGKLRAMSEKMDGAQPGDPKLAAKAIVDVTYGPHLPLRLLLGKGIWNSAKQSMLDRITDMEFCRELSEQCDFPAEPQPA